MRVSMRLRRRGFTLIEMMAAMMVLTVVMGLAVGLLVVLMRMDEATRRHEDVLSTTARLARVFRADVRAAVSVTPAVGEGRVVSQRLVMQLPDERVVDYEADTRSALRIERRDGREFRQRFRLHRPDARFVVEMSEGRPFVALEVDHRAWPREDATPSPLRIEAPLGVDRRLEVETMP